MEILVSVAAKIAEYAVAPIGLAVGYVFSYKDNFKKLKDKAEELKIARDKIIRLVEVGRRNGKEIVPDVQEWLARVDKIIEEAKHLCEDQRRTKAGCKWSCPNLCLRHQLSRKAKKVVKKVAEAQGKGKFEEVSFLPALGGVGSVSATRRFVTFDSRMSIIKDILQALQDPNVSMLGVYGFGGVGKSTLMVQLVAKAKDEKLFDVVVLAKVSQTPDLRRIQGEIADMLGLEFNEETVLGRSHRLRKRIKGEKSILIILDDIWATIDLQDVGIPYSAKINLEKGGTLSGDDCIGCKILLTSRHEDVLNKMETHSNFRLDVLSEVDTWSLFEIMAGDVVKSPSLHHTAIEVAKQCAGLPVLIVTLARALKYKDIHAWKDTLNKLRRVENKELHEIIHLALQQSFNYLESEEVKALFLLCGVLGPHVQVNYLLKCVMGLGIFKHIRTLEDARNRLYTMIGSLKSSCLLLEDDTGVKVKMHGIVQEVAISIASMDQHVFMIRKDTDLKEWPTEDSLKRCAQIILDCCYIHKLPERLESPELKFFYLDSANRSLQIPDSFFQGMENLKMLDLTCMNLSSLPTSFCFLTNLQTLCLDLCALEDMAAIGDLKNLEILSLYQSSIAKLPSEIGLLINLRMLDLSNSGIEVIPPNIISSLTKLEELRMGNTFIKWEVDGSTRQNKNASIAELKQLPKLTALDIQILEARILPRDLTFDKLERYRIFIGDVWEWIGNYETSKTLKLKLLHTSIHLEQGIKALIKRVEDLYLDEIYGISNDLYQLNGEGFPLLKHLQIQNNAKIQRIVNSVEWNQAHDSFPNLETLVLNNLHNLEKICHGPLTVNSFSKLRVIKVNNCYQLAYLFSISMVKGLSQLLEIDVSKCNSMKKIVLKESGTSVNNDIIDKIEFFRLQSLTLHHLPTLDDFYSDELTTYIPMPFFSVKVAFPYLETLKLSSINLYKIWDDDQQLLAYSIQNLIVEDCGDLKYLFSSPMVGSLSNLKRLEIGKCHMMEEIISSKEERNNGVALQEVRFPKLETIIINGMKNLKTIWHYQFDGLKTMEIKNCEKLVVVFPSHMQRKFRSLEKLMVTDCDSVKEIFELNTNEMCSEEDTTQLKKLTLLRLPKLKQIWNRDPQGILRFHNLQAVHIENCQNLEFLFPLSIPMSLLQLEEIIIKQAEGMKEIVAKKEGPVDRPVIFVFNRLTSLVLWNLHKLESFYAGNHTLACPSLREIFVFNCTRLNLFKTQSRSRQGQTPDSIHHVSVQQSLFTAEELIPNLEQLTLNNKDTSMLMQSQMSGDFSKLKLLRLCNFEVELATFPYWFLQNVPSLEWLIVDYSSFKEIFRGERCAGEEGHIKVSTRLKNLTLHQLHEFKYICKEGSKIDPVLEALESIIVKHCSSMVNLVSSSDSFSHLTYLEIENCNGLINLIAFPTARSLVKLRVMKITDCNSLETVVAEKGDETREGIAFNSLETLELNCLPQLSRFCSSKCFIKFPLLEEVVVKQCPRMEIFSKGDTSTPSLRKVQVEEDDKECRWEGNLNGTIKKLFVDMVAFCGFKHLNLSQYPELKDFWYGQLQPKMFCNLKSLVVQKCKFLSDVLFHSNLTEVLHILEELEVRECDSLEAVFDFNAMDNRGMGKQNTRLKKLTVSCLPKLKHIWKKGPREVLSFGNLCVVRAVECQSLTNLFSVSLCQDLTQLEELNIESCGVEEFVAMQEVSEEHRFSFPQLTILRLCSLTKLKSFYPGRHTLECPSLKNLSVYHCEALHIFDFDHSNSQQLHQVDEPIQRALFSIEKVCLNLELLPLNEKDVMMITNGHYQSTLFNKVERLSLQCFHQTPAIFPNDFIQRFLNLVTVQVRCSSFETLFPCHHSTGTPMHIRKLWLFDLEQLKYIWDENSQWDPFNQKLEELQIVSCSSLVNLMPSSISFKNLTNLYVWDCKGLIYLITSSTAKSLMHLRSMTIINCEMIGDVVRIDEEAEEIKFENLTYLELNSLSSLKSFCCGKHTFIFPSLLKLVVTRCPKIKIFSSGGTLAPLLRAVEVENGKKRWKDDLNTTIKHLFIDKIVANLEELKLDSKDAMIIWNGQYPADLFHNIKILALESFEEQFTFLSSFLERFPNLKRLEVSRSSSEITLPWEEMPKHFRQLRLEHLSQLKNLCYQDSNMDSLVGNLESLEIVGCSNLKNLAPCSVPFQNLITLIIDECNGLVNLVTPSMARTLVQLTTMRIVSCNMMKEIVADEGDEMEDKIAFNCLASLELTNLQSLKSFCSRNFTFNFPSLIKLIVKNCPTMDIFCPGDLIAPVLDAVETEGGDIWDGHLNTTMKNKFMQMTSKASGPKNSGVVTVGTSIVNRVMNGAI